MDATHFHFINKDTWRLYSSVTYILNQDSVRLSTTKFTCFFFIEQCSFGPEKIKRTFGSHETILLCVRLEELRAKIFAVTNFGFPKRIIITYIQIQLTFPPPLFFNL